MTQEHKDKIRESVLNLPDEIKQKIVNAVIKANTGKKHTKETIEKMRQNTKTKIKVVCVETGQIFESFSEVERKLNISRNSVSKCCKGKNKTAGGYHWRYYGK